MPPRKAEAPLINNMPRVGAADPFANLFGAMGGLPAPAAGGAGGALAAANSNGLGVRSPANSDEAGANGPLANSVGGV